QAAQATKIVEQIAADFRRHGHVLRHEAGKPMRLHVRAHTPLGEVARTLLVSFRQRSLVRLPLFTAQAIYSNAIFFT
ncbi:MFS transporter, partial [Pseudomonas syringae pv. tagetis]